jgi:hypothetical protein
MMCSFLFVWMKSILSILNQAGVIISLASASARGLWFRLAWHPIVSALVVACRRVSGDPERPF